ncbi:putative F-box/LRR-repeat protein At4g15060 isoform X2 [Rutidosis leptorrhynchoides]|uniref:putative F-box/LRR-repeat protein At4g15060 isoform X2 n=1 Tax=Rutidosis leptorrhynchoides TaxID=125765 RepID=UPI003A9947D0
MPDEVLVTILSLLPIKEAASTSILSTRWRLLWRGLIKLNFFGNQSFSYQVNMNTECDKFINQVNSVIQNYNHPMIEDFRIRYCLSNRHKSLIYQWLQFAVNKKVEFLELDLSRYVSLGFSVYVYDYPLRLFEMELVSLKKLILKKVKVSEAILLNLLSNSPNLETLSICDPQDLKHIRVGGRALKLKHFEISEGGYSVKSIYLSEFDLESFTYVGGEMDLRFSDLPKLNKVDLGQVQWWVGDNEFEMLYPLASSLQSLSIDVYRNEVPPNPRDYDELPNVKQLRMMFRGNKHDCLLHLAYMVNAFPSLESFTLEIDWTAAVVRRKARDYTNINENLKFVEIVGYKEKCAKKEDARSSAKCLESILPQGVELVIL